MYLNVPFSTVISALVDYVSKMHFEYWYTLLDMLRLCLGYV